MSYLSLEKARAIAEGVLSYRLANGLKPLGIIVLDGRGALKSALIEDGSALLRGDIAFGKAYGAVAMGMGSRSINKHALERPHFVAAAQGLTRDRLVPVPGGVLILDNGSIIGAVGVSGDTSDNDEAAAVNAIEAAGYKAEPGAN
jgi:uncharacterized protein GlcG (DUF336 family)